jgi:hypothetical protein
MSCEALAAICPIGGNGAGMMGLALAVMCPIGGNGAGMMGLAFAIVTETAKMDPKTTL